MKIIPNMGAADRVFRFLIAALLMVLYFTHVINGVTAIILMTLAVIFVLTSFISFCPLYLPFNINTKHKNTH